jgi:phosphoribosylglycinamide formyltransferase-1
MPTASDPIRLAVLLSGSGTTLQNLLDRIADGRLRATIRLVVSSSAEALGL